jgi:hypothetical protein
LFKHTVEVSAITKINRKDFGLTWNAAFETHGILVGNWTDWSLPVLRKKIAPFLIFCSLFEPLPSPAGIRDADRPRWQFRAPGDHTECRSLKRVAAGMPPEGSGIPDPGLESGRLWL